MMDHRYLKFIGLNFLFSAILLTVLLAVMAIVGS